jgi:hypothetical protein
MCSITAWVLAAAAFGVWYNYDKKKEREFSQDEVDQWNKDVLIKTKTASEAKRQQQTPGTAK